MKWTMFRSAAAMQREEKEQSTQELFEYLQTAGPFESKTACPWIKLATFGNMRTGKNSLRHNANVMSVTGVEGDYDGGEVSPEDAVAMLEKHQIRAIVYTSPSHTAKKPRWRVIAPCAKAHAPSARTALLARVNGALGGILADESFTLSQSYYFGRVEGVEYKVLMTFGDADDGSCVDDLDELDDIAIRKVAKVHPGDAGATDEVRADYSVNMFDRVVGMLGRKLKTGDNRREMLKSYISSRSNRGLTRDEVISMVEGVVSKYFDPADPIDQANVLSMLDDFTRKDFHKVDQPVDLSGFLASIDKLPPTQEQDEPDNEDAMPRSVPAPKPPKRESRRKDSLIDYPPPYEGVMLDIVEAASAAAYKPQPQLNILAALIGMAGCINGEYSTHNGGRFNLYGLGSLASGGGKDRPRMVAETVAAMSGATILGKPGSGAGLEDALAAKKNQLVSIDEIAHILKSMNDDRAAAHVSDIGACLLKLYSASNGAYNKRILAKNPHRAKETPTVVNPCVSLIGFATPDGLGEAFHERNLGDGLMGRMLYVPGNPDVKVRMPDAGFNLPQSIETIVKSIQPVNPLAFVGPIASSGSVVVEYEHGLMATIRRLLSELEENRDMSLGELVKPLYGRSHEKMLRIAGVLAIWEDPTAPVMRMRHVEWGRAMVLASDDHLLDFASRYMHNNDVTRHASRIRGYIERILAGDYAYQRDLERVAVEEGSAVARSQLLRVSKLDKLTFDRAMAHMQDLGELVSFDKMGKPLPVIQEIDLQDE